MTDTSPNIAKAALVLAGITQTQIAQQCGVEANTVNAVVHGRARSRKVELRIAAATGQQPATLWPQWYGPDAKRRAKRRTPMQITAALEQLKSLAEAG